MAAPPPSADGLSGEQGHGAFGEVALVGDLPSVVGFGQDGSGAAFRARTRSSTSGSGCRSDHIYDDGEQRPIQLPSALRQRGGERPRPQPGDLQFQIPCRARQRPQSAPVPLRRVGPGRHAVIIVEVLATQGHQIFRDHGRPEIPIRTPAAPGRQGAACCRVTAAPSGRPRGPGRGGDE